MRLFSLKYFKLFLRLLYNFLNYDEYYVIKTLYLTIKNNSFS